MNPSVKFGICEWTLPITGPYVCKFAKEIGYDGVQLIVGDYAKRFPLFRKVVQAAYREMAEMYAIEFTSIATRVPDYFSIFAPEGTEEHAIVREGIDKAIEAASSMAVEIVLIPSFVKSEVRSEEDFQRLVHELQRSCDLGADSGILVATENAMSVDETIRLFEQVDRANLRLYFDLENYHANAGFYTPDLIKPLMPYICQVHAKDGKDKAISSVLLGRGDSHLHESAARLKELNYSGWIVNENYYDVPPLVNENDDPVELMKRDLNTLRTEFS